MPLLERLARQIAEQVEEERPGAVDQSWSDWAKAQFPQVASAPFAPRHLRMGAWFEALERGVRPVPRVESWGRGGAKSACAEMGTTYVGAKGTRRLCLYVSDTKDQAIRHLQTIAGQLERLGIERQLNIYGHSKGWRSAEIRTATGFTAVALGLDVAVRGIKIDEVRPDLIIFDDLDNAADSPLTIRKKIDAITSSILPAGSMDCAVLVAQNLIHEQGIVYQLAYGFDDEETEFLVDREVFIEAALEPGWVIGRTVREDGKSLWTLDGAPTWEGQPLAKCEEQLNAWGKAKFVREALQDVHAADGFFFDADELFVEEMPPRWDGWRFCLGFDLAATEGGGDFTAGVLLGRAPNGMIWFIDVRNVQYSEEKVRALLLDFALEARAAFGAVKIRLPQDPGQAGKAQCRQLARMLRMAGIPAAAIVVRPVTGRKSTRAKGLASTVNAGNARMVPAPWNVPLKTQYRRFREDEEHEFDDLVDAGADAYNELATGRKELRGA